MRELGPALRVLRAIRGGMTQRALARAAGITPAALCDYEAGQRRLGLRTLYRLLNALDFRLSVLEEPAALVVQLQSPGYLPDARRAGNWSALRFDLAELPREES